MPVAKVQVILHHDSGLPEDDVVNTFHFDILATPFVAAEADDMIDDVIAFYTTNGTSGHHVSEYLSQNLTGLATFKVYALADPLPRVPLVTRTSVAIPTATSGVQMPQEVALCLSYSAAPVSGTIAARRRGRLYIGPFQDTARSAGDGSPASALRLAMREAGKRLMLSTDTNWCVFSPTDNSSGTIVQGYVDNAWDTQRRRGTAPTVRETFTALTPP